MDTVLGPLLPFSPMLLSLSMHGGHSVCSCYFCLFIHRVSFQEKMQAVHHFIKDHKMSKDLSVRIGRYLTLLWTQYRYKYSDSGA